ncbi:hypothetical protein TNCV_2380051 [Trichonephila clavipes]|nr:hypothetical protein TNCV_2380051 [Trichonephila clavipes]
MQYTVSNGKYKSFGGCIRMIDFCLRYGIGKLGGIVSSVYVSKSSSHSTKLVQTFMRENKVQLLNWPGKSPDLNSIENLGHILKNRLAKMSSTTIEQMIKRAKQVRFQDDVDPVKNVCAVLVK